MGPPISVQVSEKETVQKEGELVLLNRQLDQGRD